jgi:hypothetical protein
MVVDFETLSGIPEEFIRRLKSYNDFFLKCKFLEQLCQDNNIIHLITDINNYCSEKAIIGYHYTNGIERDFLEKGLVVRTGRDIRQDFVKRHFHLFSEKEQRQILKNWEKQFDQGEAELRDDSIYFNFLKEALHNGGAEDLLKYYGGEQVYLPLLPLAKVRKKLERIGIPMILRCKLNPKDIAISIENPWGKIAVSKYHRAINPVALLEDQDGCQRINVNPDNIEIIKL